MSQACRHDKPYLLLKKLSHSHLLWIFGITALLINGCADAVITNPPLLAIPSNTSTQIPIAATYTKTATSTISPTLTSSPTATITPTVTVTWTPLPTLSYAELVKKVKELEATNGGCLLPCWWGIEPGKTPWDEARTFLESLSLKINLLYQEVYSQWYGVDFENINGILKRDMGISLSVRNGVITFMRLPVFYPLHEILSTYGPPDEIWVTARFQSPCPFCPKTGAEFALGLMYQTRGFLASFRGGALRTDFSTYRICPINILGIYQTAWILWDPARNLGYGYVYADAFLNAPLLGAYRLEEDSDIDIRTFYERYKDPNNASLCFEVPNRDD